jgi:hypothetical protein
MSYEFYIDRNLETVFIRHSGAMALDEALDQIEKMLNSPLYIPGFNILRDTRSASLPAEWNYNWFREISPDRAGDKFLQLGRCRAAWVTKSGKNFRIAHQASISDRLSSSTIQRQAFTDISKALQWLDIPEDYKITYPE